MPITELLVVTNSRLKGYLLKGKSLFTFFAIFARLWIIIV